MARTLASSRKQETRATRRPRALAAHLAACACHMRLLIELDLNSATAPYLSTLYQQARADTQADLTHEAFADLLAQMLIYCSLLVRRLAQVKAISFTQALSDFLALPHLPLFVAQALDTLYLQPDCTRDELANYIGKLTAFLHTTDLQAILTRLDAGCTQNDALMYFYELFLAHYAPRQRSQQGVYYTPIPVIAYMVRALDHLLRERFAYAGGLAEALQAEQAESGVLLCDPACGTGAFLLQVLDYVRQVSFAPSRSLQTRLSGYEIMPAASVLARIELAVHQARLEKAAEDQNSPQEIHTVRPIAAHISLVNALYDAHPLVSTGSYLPIILGNPPYAGHSLNHTLWLSHLLESYKTGDRGLKKPAQTKWLNDDYVQFLRLAQWQIEQAGRGIIAFLTNHSYLDNPTFRAMRLSLLRAFDEIYVLNLHGNSKRRELAPNGERDSNIFTIQQGVAISIFVKWPNEQSAAHERRSGAHNDTFSSHLQQTLSQAQQLPEIKKDQPLLTQATKRAASEQQIKAERLATVHYADVWGERAVYTPGSDGTRQLSGGKLGWLARHDLESTPWQTSRPCAPFYLLTPRDERYQAEYMAYWSLPAIFALNGDPAPGLVTCHDDFAISWSEAEARAKIDTLLTTTEEAQARELFRLCTQRQWNYTLATRELQKGTWRQALGRLLYRPFDTRWTVFERHVAVHLRERVTRQMRAGPNLALVVGRAGQVIDGGKHWDVAFCSRLPTEFNLYRRGGNYLFPLYLYASPGTKRLANLSPHFINEICQHLNLYWLPEGCGDLQTTIGPEDIFAYIYALLYTPSYRARYTSFLQIDFPRVPLPTRIGLLRSLCPLGRALSQAHLLDQPLSTPLAWSEDTARSRVAHVNYCAYNTDEGTVSINSDQYLEHIPAHAWTFTIGGYQVAKRWLWDRRARQLSRDELTHYCQIIASLTYTCELMSELDRTLEEHGDWPL